MARKERRFVFKSGTSQKFWQISIEGASLTVRFGRIGTSGQERKKRFGNAGEAEREGEKLVREKTAKGYVEKEGAAPRAEAKIVSQPTRKGATKARKPVREKATKPSKQAQPRTKIEEIAKQVEDFYQAAEKEEGFETYTDELESSGEREIATLAKKYDLKIPDDVRQFLKRGLRYTSLSIDFPSGGHASAYFSWLRVDQIDDHIAMFRELAPRTEGKERLLLESGFPITHDEPQLFLDASGRVYHYSTRNRLDPPIAGSLTEFLTYWLEAGCFAAGALNAYLPRIEHLVPGRIPPKKNPWIKYYRRVFAKYV